MNPACIIAPPVRGSAPVSEGTIVMYCRWLVCAGADSTLYHVDVDSSRKNGRRIVDRLLSSKGVDTIQSVTCTNDMVMRVFCGTHVNEVFDSFMDHFLKNMYRRSKDLYYEDPDGVGSWTWINPPPPTELRAIFGPSFTRQMKRKASMVWCWCEKATGTRCACF